MYSLALSALLAAATITSTVDSFTFRSSTPLSSNSFITHNAPSFITRNTFHSNIMTRERNSLLFMSSKKSNKGDNVTSSSPPILDVEIEEDEEPISSSSTSTEQTSSSSSSSSTSSSTTKTQELEEQYSSVPDQWEELHGNYILRPTQTFTNEDGTIQPPRALLHFLGGALIGAAPDIAYRYLLERLAAQNFLIVATPYNLSFDYLTTCDAILEQFEEIAPTLAREYGPVPVVGVGHSCGALLHLIITTLFPDTPRAANALLSYNNNNVKDAVPLFDELVAPAFTMIGNNSTQTNMRGASGVQTIKLFNHMVKTTLNGEIPSNDMIRELTESILPPPLFSSSSSNSTSTSEIPLPDIFSIPDQIRTTLQTNLLEPTLSTLASASLLPPLRQSVQILDQIPNLIQEIADGTEDFTPPRSSIQASTKRAYRARRTLLIQYKGDTIDESEDIEQLLKEAETVMRLKRPMIRMDVQRQVLEGNHATPILAPYGVDWADNLQDITSVLNFGNLNFNENEDKESQDGSTDTKKQKEGGVKVLYKQVDDTVDALVKWLEEGQL